MASLAIWTVGQFGLWAVLYVCLKNVQVFKEKPAMAAFNLTVTAPVLALSYFGLLQLDFVTEQPAIGECTLQYIRGYDTLECTSYQRIYGYNAVGEQIGIAQLAMQFFKTAVAVLTGDSELNKPEALGHHVVTAAGMCLCLCPFGQSYAGIFFGLTELSTVPLNVVFMFKRFDSLREIYPTTELLAKACFSLLFLILRVDLTGIKDTSE